MTPDPSDDGVDVDAAWAEIIANWDAPTVDPRRPERAPAEEAGVAPAETGADAAEPADPEGEAPSLPTGRHARTDRAATSAQEAQDRLETDRVAGELSWDELGITDDPPRPAPPQGSGPAGVPPAGFPVEQGGRSAGPGSGPRDVDPSGPSLLDGLDGEGESEGYEMPDPPKLPRPSLITALSWVGAIGAPLLLLLAAIFWRTAPPLLIGGAVIAFIAGFISLVFRMPERDEDDDGAVV